jgi:ABC-type polysaccharide/polyol phosphate transport system ATPase subunit
VKDGERLGIVGRNGAGKSTLLRTISRIYEPTMGHIDVHGRVAPLLDIGAGFHPEFTGRENIYFNGAFLGYSKEQLREIEKEVIAFAELEDFIDSPVKYYSTGMYMRLAFSLATTVHPDILILDELFVGGDASFVQRGKKRMNKMIDKSSVMILVSHDPSLLRSLCDRYIWLDHGKVIDDGDVKVLDAYVSTSAT